ncbi:MAG: hypothetical protein ACJ71Z_01660 [Aeromicrobium sp.]
MRRALLILCVTGLTACGHGPAPTASKAQAPQTRPIGVQQSPTLALETSNGVDSVVAWIRGSNHKQIAGSFEAIAPNGSIIVMRAPSPGSQGGPQFYDVATGKPTAIGDRFSATDAIGFGEGVVLTIRTGENNATLRAFDGEFRQVREFPLPGKSSADGSGTHYGSPVIAGGVVFAVRTDGIGGGGKASDELVRLTRDGKITASLVDKHARALAVSADRRTLVAVLTAGPKVGSETPADTTVVAIGPKSGELTKSYQLPPPCRGGKRSGSCVVRVEMTGTGELVARVAPSGNGQVGSTWLTTGKGWTEDRPQRGRIVVWQQSGRLVRADRDSVAGPVTWFDQDGSTRDVAGSTKARAWWAPGTLYQP